MDLLFLPASAGAQLDTHTRVYWQPERGAGMWQNVGDCAEASSGPVALVIPVEVCSFFAVELPTRKARWIEQAMAYAVEELLAENVDDLHLARGEVLDDGRYRVVAVRRRVIGEWVGQLRALGFSIAAIHVDADLLPRTDTRLLFLGQRGLLGGAIEARLAFDTASWPDLASQLPPPRHAYGTDPEAPADVEHYQRVSDPFEFLAEGRAQALDLAQGELATRDRHTGLARWKPVAVVAALLAVLQVGLMVGQTWYLREQGDQLADASRSLYQELFPEDTRIVNLRAQFDQHLTLGNAPSADFLRLLDQAASAVAGQPGVVIDQLEYDEAGGGLAMQVNAPDFAALEQFRQRLGETGQPVQLGSASRAEGGVSARVTIGG